MSFLCISFHSSSGKLSLVTQSPTQCHCHGEISHFYHGWVKCCSKFTAYVEHGLVGIIFKHCVLINFFIPQSCPLAIDFLRKRDPNLVLFLFLIHSRSPGTHKALTWVRGWVMLLLKRKMKKDRSILQSQSQLHYHEWLKEAHTIYNHYILCRKKSLIFAISHYIWLLVTWTAQL